MVTIYNPLNLKKTIYDILTKDLEGIECSENYVEMNFKRGEEHLNIELYDIIHESQISETGKDIYYQSFIYKSTSNTLFTDVVKEKIHIMGKVIYNEQEYIQFVFLEYPIVEEEYQ